MTDWLVAETHRKTTPNIYEGGQVQPVEAVVYHYTGSSRPEPTIKWLCMSSDDIINLYARKAIAGRPPPPASAHFVVQRDGKVVQLAPLSARTWHAGAKTSCLSHTLGGWCGREVNLRTIGIEIMNVGPLQVHDDGEAYTLSGEKFTGPALSAGGKPKYVYTAWEAYTPEQYNALQWLTKELVKIFPLLGASPETRLVGHEDVDPTRKIDPGPAFNWRLIRMAAEEAYAKMVGHA